MIAGHPVTQEVRALAGLDLESLRREWRARYGEPPKLRSADLLRRNLAWRIQAAAFGGLDPRTQAAVLGKASAQGPRLTPGMRITREWRGKRHEVEVTEAGFIHKGETFDSLSKIARDITGTRWNGPRFFGLRPGASA